MDDAIKIEIIEGVPTIIIRFSSCDLAKATVGGLSLMLEMLVEQQMFEQAAIVRNEINRRTKNEQV